MNNKSKHIDVRVYSLREFVQEGSVVLYHISTTVQVEDVLTKSLSAVLLKRHQDVMLGMELPV